MYNLDFNTPANLHFTGIGGISMSALAEIMISRGFTVTGSDSHESKITDHLESLGAKIFYNQVAGNISSDIDVLIYTAAIKQDNPELVKAKELGIPLLTRAEFLGQIMLNYPMAIGVSGTHGKTTTTSMLSQIMLEGNTDPTILVGGIMPAIHGNTRVGHSDKLITEACEYTNSFLSFKPNMAIILNVAADHLDFFKDLDDIRHSFRKFAELVPDDGFLVINSDIDNLEYFTDGLKCKVITVGSDPAKSDYSATNIKFDQFAKGSYDLVVNGEKSFHVALNVTGEHNIYNSLAAIAAAHAMGISDANIKAGLTQYGGTDRRFQYKGKVGDVTIIDDYAHHPDEITATIKTAKHYPHKKMWVVFQPHTYSRTKSLLPEFGKALKEADAVVLADIYAAREKDTLGVSSLDVKKEIEKYGTEVHYYPSFSEIENFLLESCSPGDLLITMGAGDVVKIGEHLLGK
ncbi:UDP-N-acetylmuramate--L-alanine ligase [Eubacterium sp.]|uniref:UDP-N-acetylmuramate--L-alanine ligase n=1 Tax=Eubacterium sp. TaxID=142586 RepID=UPI001DB6564A|nr:UDP-N-acetylmuramate--L-alanine ligase [Eubacterium sp.]MBS5619224.1 UDP-N-acetylmuramate--L-alanine ligase [Eubacterium sp.]